ncbi:MAG: hypothetical protein WBP71_07585 [Terracidiphilus sp.]
MEDWKKIGFKLSAMRGDGEEWTPETMPMARLVEYLADLAIIFGHEEHVHLIKVSDGSTQPIFWMHPTIADQAIFRMRRAEKEEGDPKAISAYKRINVRLITDNGRADVVDMKETDEKAKIIEFPGKLEAHRKIRSIRESASIAGELRRVGGIDKSIHLLIRQPDGAIISVESDEAFAKRLEREGWLFKLIRIHGIATWERDESGTWHLEKFKAHSYDPEPLVDEPFADTIKALRSIPGNKWNDLTDPLGELEKMRHGEG